MPALPIEDHGVIGDLHTIALVGRDGTIDWWCPERFDAPAVFAGLLDDERGGTWALGPEPDGITHKQLYVPDSNVLVTRFMSPDGVVEVTDFMPMAPRDGETRGRLIVRRVEGVRGRIRLCMRCAPAFDYGETRADVRALGDAVAFAAGDRHLVLRGSVPLAVEDGAATAEFTIGQGDRATLILEAGTGTPAEPTAPDDQAIDRLFERTVDYWHDWLSTCTYRGRWREMVYRSALTLKLLTYAPTGAIVAAPTTSLPELVGGARNWDYRYTWIRDASFTIYALSRIGFTAEARAFIAWLYARLDEVGPDGRIQVMYAVDGRHDLTERTCDGLKGYRGSQPVRVGNAAHRQLQLDLYGELVDATYLYNKYGTPIAHDQWVQLRRVLNHVCDIWREPDAGIWEVRGGPRHFVHSKVMCWVALDRGIRLAEKRAFPADRQRWLTVRDEIYEDVMAHGWDEQRGAFVQSYGSTTLDAALLLLPLVFFVSPEDPRFLRTLDAIQQELTNGSLVHRYNPEASPDGVDEPEGTFTMCSFWLVEALTRVGRVADARIAFERMLGYANHLGLYSEEIGPSGEALGNFPQAFTHLALITAAVNLNRALGGRGQGERSDEFWAD
ncbi:MAG: glycoside hydrolase family 15 protein [Vicinamibacterales bacterium]